MGSATDLHIKEVVGSNLTGEQIFSQKSYVLHAHFLKKKSALKAL